MAQLNVDADELATEALLEVQAEFPQAPPGLLPLPTCGAYLLHKGVHQTSHEIRTLCTAICGPELQEYLCRWNEWTEETFSLIDWTAYAQAIQK